MTEQITKGTRGVKEVVETRSYFEVMHELFFAGKDEKGKVKKSALEQYAKVRRTQYELSLWRYHGVPLGQIDSRSRTYFSESFLYGTDIGKVDSTTLNAAYERLCYAVKDGCHGRCTRLVEELNACLKSFGFDTVNVEKFLDFFTFNYRTRNDDYGYPLKEPGYSFEIRDFVDEFYRNLFREEIRFLEKQSRVMSPRDVLSVINFRLKTSRVLKKKK